MRNGALSQAHGCIMVKVHTEGVEQVYRLALKSGDLRAAYDQLKKKKIPVGTWKNVNRGWPAWRANNTAQPAQAQAGAAAAASTPAEARTRGAARSEASALPRAGEAVGQRCNRTPYQVDIARKNEALWERDWIEAHKAATLEYADIVKRGMQRRSGCTAAEVAAKHTATLASDSTWRDITAAALVAQTGHVSLVGEWGISTVGLASSVDLHYS